MKGPSGFMRVSATVMNNINPVPLIAAPGVGWQICMFKFQGSQNGANFIRLEDTTSKTYWQGIWSSQRPAYDFDPCGLFVVDENMALQVANLGLVQVQFNYTYEIQPVGT